MHLTLLTKKYSRIYQHVDFGNQEGKQTSAPRIGQKKTESPATTAERLVGLIAEECSSCTPR
jgi:hypothetical protein